MITDILPPPSQRRGARRAGPRALAAALAIVATAMGCAEDPPASAPADPVVDAGPDCERGTQGCACIGGSGCQDDLLCAAGRCQLTEGEREPAQPPPQRPPPQRPPSSLGDAGPGDAPSPPAPAALDAGADAAADASP
jgi:hypothetical protein